MKKTKATPFTRFMDMHSGGNAKEKWEYIYIEATEAEACIVFYNRFGHNPSRVSCTCCGDDYSIGEHESIEQATAYNRNCDWDDKKKKYVECQRKKYCYGKYITLKEYLKNKDILVIRSKDIKPKERIGDVPEQGYVWKE